jgi:hypothetical protein
MVSSGYHSAASKSPSAIDLADAPGDPIRRSLLPSSCLRPAGARRAGAPGARQPDDDGRDSLGRPRYRHPVRLRYIFTALLARRSRGYEVAWPRHRSAHIAFVWRSDLSRLGRHAGQVPCCRARHQIRHAAGETMRELAIDYGVGHNLARTAGLERQDDAVSSVRREKAARASPLSWW